MTKSLPSLALIVDRVAPWLVANFNAASRLLDFAAIELDTQSETSSAAATEAKAFTVFAYPNGRAAGRAATAHISRSLSAFSPDAVLTFGWDGPKNLAAMRWCANSRVPIIVASDSTARDFPRNAAREAAKSAVLSTFSAGWAAGTRAAAYLRALGLPAERIVQGPVDTIDITHFQLGADNVRADAAIRRARLNLPERYFLAVSRLSPEKNLPRLVAAYARYCEMAGSAPWHLVIIGEGPARQEIQKAITNFGVTDKVLLKGWVGFSDLPQYYGLAGAFVLASLKDTWGCVVNEAAAAGLPLLVSDAAGSSPELVDEGVNGYILDPLSDAQMAVRLRDMAQGPVDRAAMAAASRARISRWSPQHYAASLADVTRLALELPPRQPSLFARATVSALAEFQMWRR